MQSIPKDAYLEFNSNTLHDVRKDVNLHQPGVIEELIRRFENWIQKQPHFIKKDFNKHFLEFSLIMAKGSLVKARQNLDKLCSMKTLVPKFFTKHDIKNELIDISSFIIHTASPKLTEDNYRVFMAKILTTKIDSNMFADYYRHLSLMCEYMKVHEYSRGSYVVVDLRDINIFSLVTKINVFDLRNLFLLSMGGHGMRIKSIHFISDSLAVNLAVAVMRQVLSKKLGERINVHKTLDSLHAHVPKGVLAEDFGGSGKPLKTLYNEMVEALSTEENVAYFRDICQPGTNEALRNKTRYDDDDPELSEAFQDLQID